ncbi:hypothetical protein SAMN02746041_00035 [Desulfacinum hydrothermale DSM 13146]|uniref:Patatin-like phospholipase n=1 Tax=Desulfacinum hydrothermale DSM 13146 TaxID=1121390 RepID=A0A1W1WXB7_9BACT|nr:hypothetical protein [Desulfacinum hydrothermale]SMC16243.1 hypothetical protein SAMN02746041_00035 [Desulfacinum hydrothermale DSM 13146]
MDHRVACYAGPGILPVIREEGFSFHRVRWMWGAAGGPKWLVLYGMDRALCQEWLPQRRTPLNVVGSSIGSWRFAAYCRRNPLDALESFLEAYLAQSYSSRPTAAEVSRVLGQVLDRLVPQAAVREIVDHPLVRLHVATTRGRGLVASRRRPLLSLGLGLAYGINALSRKGLLKFFERVYFCHSQSELPQCLDNGAFPLKTVSLTGSNARAALLASGSIPLLMEGVDAIPGAPPGPYWDGGLLDYHLTVPVPVGPEEVVFYPHYTDRLVPGWFDKRFAHRRPDLRAMKNLFLVVPSRSFVESLPYGRIPDRQDFWTFAGNDAERLAFWKTVLQRSRDMGKAFMDLAGSSVLRHQVRPLEEFFQGARQAL